VATPPEEKLLAVTCAATLVEEIEVNAASKASTDSLFMAENPGMGGCK
jgi:hypothetical protein